MKKKRKESPTPPIVTTMKQKEKLAIYNNSLYPYGIEEDTNLGVKQLGIIHYMFYTHGNKLFTFPSG